MSANEIESNSNFFKKVSIGYWILYIVFILFIAILCGFSVAIANTTTDVYRVIVFCALLGAIVIAIGAYSLTIG